MKNGGAQKKAQGTRLCKSQLRALWWYGLATSLSRFAPLRSMRMLARD
jgi:hypothetical protein